MELRSTRPLLSPGAERTSLNLQTGRTLEVQLTIDTLCHISPDPIWKFVTAEERLELPPGQVTDYLALCGDTSDGIPGVKGIGPKTAAELLQEFDSLDAILAAATLGTIPGAVGKKLKEQRDHALKCRQVVELRDALKLPELVGWRPRFDWRSQLQALGLASVEAIISSIEPHLKNTTTQTGSVL